jgi:hypothetical protein
MHAATRKIDQSSQSQNEAWDPAHQGGATR